MKATLTLILILFPLSHAQAWSLESRIQANSRGQFQDSVTLYCRADESLCLKICGDEKSCWKEQELCFNCLGTGNFALRTVFTAIERLYQNTLKTLETEDVEKVFKQDHVFVAARSIYNFYLDLNDEKIRNLFQSLCPFHSTQPLVVLGKNSLNEPIQIKYIVCEDPVTQNHDMYALEYRPQVIIENDQLDNNKQP